MYVYSNEWITSNFSFLRPDQGHGREKTRNPRKSIPSTSTQIELSMKTKNKKWQQSISSHENEETNSQSSSNPEYVINPKLQIQSMIFNRTITQIQAHRLYPCR